MKLLCVHECGPYSKFIYNKTEEHEMYVLQANLNKLLPVWLRKFFSDFGKTCASLNLDILEVLLYFLIQMQLNLSLTNCSS